MVNFSSSSNLFAHNFMQNCKDLKWCVLSLKEALIAGKRLDATFAEGKHARDIIHGSIFPVIPLSGNKGLVDAYTCARFKRVWVEQSDLPIYQPATIIDTYPKPDGYISHVTKTSIEKLKVKKGQILLTCSGTIGKASFVSDTLCGKLFSHDLMRICCKNDIDMGYVYTFLKSEIGNKLLVTNSYGAVVTHIESEHLEGIPIPNPPNEIKAKLNDLIMRSYALRDESNRLMDQATMLLTAELNLPKLSEFNVPQFASHTEIDNFSVKLSSIAHRLDGSFHVPVVGAIMQHLKKHAKEVVTLDNGNVCQRIYQPGRFKRIYVDKDHGVNFFGISQISSLDPRMGKYISIKGLSSKMRDELILEDGELLISRSGTIGDLCIVPPHWKGWIASEDLIRIVLHKDICGYVYCFLNTDVGQALIKRFSFGAVQDHIDCDQISQIAIPLLKDGAIQDEINNLVEQCNRKREEAFHLEQQAMQILEKDILGIG